MNRNRNENQVSSLGMVIGSACVLIPYMDTLGLLSCVGLLR